MPKRYQAKQAIAKGEGYAQQKSKGKTPKIYEKGNAQTVTNKTLNKLKINSCNGIYVCEQDL